MDMKEITMLGHKDHGKSTLIGSLLIATDSVTKERIEEAKSTSKKLGRKFEPAYILDAFSEEREGGLTIDTARAQIKYKNNAFELIDVPGHEELIKNMISGASYADTAILVVSASPKEGIKPQTKRHVFLAGMLGIDNIIIAINKMDAAGYSENRFETIKSELYSYLLKIGFKSHGISAVPISAYASENIASQSTKMPWYKGPTLLDAISSSAKEPDKTQPARLLVQGTIDFNGISAHTAKVLSGKVKNGAKLRIVPQGQSTVIKKIFVKGKAKQNANSGENVALILDNNFGSMRGSVISATNKTRAASTIGAKVFFVKKSASDIELKLNGQSIDSVISIDKIIDPISGSPLEALVPKPLQAAECIIKLDRKSAAEEFSSFKPLGRFVFYSHGKFAGIGTIEKILN